MSLQNKGPQTIHMHIVCSCPSPCPSMTKQGEHAHLCGLPTSLLTSMTWWKREAFAYMLESTHLDKQCGTNSSNIPCYTRPFEIHLELNEFIYGSSPNIPTILHHISNAHLEICHYMLLFDIPVS
jgi:hypothetical protein